jgi:hypothetical protein
VFRAQEALYSINRGADAQNDGAARFFRFKQRAADRARARQYCSETQGKRPCSNRIFNTTRNST